MNSFISPIDCKVDETCCVHLTGYELAYVQSLCDTELSRIELRLKHNYFLKGSLLVTDLEYRISLFRSIMEKLSVVNIVKNDV